MTVLFQGKKKKKVGDYKGEQKLDSFALSVRNLAFEALDLFIRIFWLHRQPVIITSRDVALDPRA